MVVGWCQSYWGGDVVMMCRVGCVMMDPSFGITSAGGLTNCEQDPKTGN